MSCLDVIWALELIEFSVGTQSLAYALTYTIYPTTTTTRGDDMNDEEYKWMLL